MRLFDCNLCAPNPKPKTESSATTSNVIVLHLPDSSPVVVSTKAPTPTATRRALVRPATSARRHVTVATIALERRDQRARHVLERATEQKVRITVPAAVITEWWRSRTDIRERILAAVRVESLSESLAKVAGEALSAVKGATSVDAIVMASAAQRGDVVYTADVSELTKLASYFRTVRVLAIG